MKNIRSSQFSKAQVLPCGYCKTFKRQPYKMVKHSYAIRHQQPTNCLSMFYHFVRLALKGLRVEKKKVFTDYLTHSRYHCSKHIEISQFLFANQSIFFSILNIYTLNIKNTVARYHIFTMNKPSIMKKSKYQKYFHCFIICILVPYAF